MQIVWNDTRGRAPFGINYIADVTYLIKKHRSSRREFALSHSLTGTPSDAVFNRLNNIKYQKETVKYGPFLFKTICYLGI